MVNPSSQGTQGSKIATRRRSQNSQASQPNNSKAAKKEIQRERGEKLAKQLAEKRAGGEKFKPTSKSKRAGIFFPVSRIIRYLKKSNPRLVVRSNSAVLLASVMEYLTAELLEIAGEVSAQFHRKRIIPRDLLLAIKNDEEFSKFFSKTTLVQGGVVPRIHPELVGTKKSRQARVKTEQNKEEKPVPSQTSTPMKRKHGEDDQSSNKPTQTKRVKQ